MLPAFFRVLSHIENTFRKGLQGGYTPWVQDVGIPPVPDTGQKPGHECSGVVATATPESLTATCKRERAVKKTYIILTAPSKFPSSMMMAMINRLVKKGLFN